MGFLISCLSPFGLVRQFRRGKELDIVRRRIAQRFEQPRSHQHVVRLMSPAKCSSDFGKRPTSLPRWRAVRQHKTHLMGNATQIEITALRRRATRAASAAPAQEHARASRANHSISNAAPLLGSMVKAMTALHRRVKFKAMMIGQPLQTACGLPRESKNCVARK